MDQIETETETFMRLTALLVAITISGHGPSPAAGFDCDRLSACSLQLSRILRRGLFVTEPVGVADHRQPFDRDRLSDAL